MERIHSLKLFDKTFIAFFLTLNVLLLLFHQNVEHWEFAFGAFIAHLIVVASIIFIIPKLSRSESMLLQFLRDWYPVLSFTFIYWETGNFIHMIFPFELDRFIISFETALFGISPNVWVQQFENSFLTELMQLSYSAYWVLIPIVGAMFYFNRQYKEYEILIASISMAFFISYLLFILVPVVGPRFALADQVGGLSDVPPGGIGAVVRSFVNKVGLRGGAFPSSHVAVAMILLLFSWRFYPVIAKVMFLPIVTLLMFATVYCQYHYVTDVVAGSVIGIFLWFLGFRRLSKDKG
ncbi:MAG: phosphatase PAP2 family protein [Bacteroidota bacterium]